MAYTMTMRTLALGTFLFRIPMMKQAIIIANAIVKASKDIGAGHFHRCRAWPIMI